MTEYRGDGLRAEKIKEDMRIAQEDLEIRKRKLTESLEMKDHKSKFTATYDAVASEISAATVGQRGLVVGWGRLVLVVGWGKLVVVVG